MSTVSATPRELPVRVIEPRSAGVFERLREFWSYRTMTVYFGRQMVEKMYRRTWLGWLWIPLRPAMAVGPSAFVFGGLLGVSSGDVPYPLFYLVSQAAWELFTLTMLWGTRSIEMGRRVLHKMYVPRLTCLVGAVVPAGVIFGVYFLMAVLTFTFFGISDGHLYLHLGINTLATFAGMLLLVALALSVACFTSVYGAQARDVRFTLGYAMSFWMFLTPVIYPMSQVPASYRTVTALNPATAPIELFRMGLFGDGQIPTTALISCFGTIAVIGSLGLWFFNRSEIAALDVV
jgi:lipopolysaccharide transport system permease protein